MTSQTQAMRAAGKAVYDTLRPAGRALVACSGGRDSLALAVLAARMARRASCQVGAVVIDHGLHAASAQVAAQTAAMCAALGLAPVRVRRVQVGAAGGPEAAARTARYEGLEAVARELGIDLVLLGHTLDDQAETVLLALARGSGTRSLAGIPARRGVFARPLLGVRRAVTAALCRAAGLQWWDDPTNAGDPGDPLRSRVRAHVLPALVDTLGEGALAALARTATLARADADLLDDLAGAAYQDLPRPLELTVLRALPAALRTRVLRRLLVEAGAPAGQLGATHVGAVNELVMKSSGRGSAHLPGDLQVSVGCGTLEVAPRALAPQNLPPHRR